MSPNEIRRNTGLSPTQQEERARIARAWAARVLSLVKESACSIRLALRAVEQTEQNKQR